MQSTLFDGGSCEARSFDGTITRAQSSSSVPVAPDDRLAMEILSEARLQLLKVANEANGN